MGLVAIDIFAGGGGLTVGLKGAGFEVAAAVEIEKHAYATYRANHPEVKALKQDVRTVSRRELEPILSGTRIDLLAGCPPCQGFTSLTSKYKRDDARNALVLEMARLAREVNPRAIMMENVPRLRDKPVYKKMWLELEALGYRLEDAVLDVANYGVPQRRKRLVLLGGQGFPIEPPLPSHSERGRNGLSPWRTVRDVVGNMGEPVTLNKAKESGAVEASDWHIVRTLSDKNAARIRLARAGESWSNIPENLRPVCHQGGYRGFTNVYGRMAWDSPSPTITGGCTTFSKGRFGHPVQNRTISVREAALLQTFPEHYRFDTPFMGYVCNIIGNALPCKFAEIVSFQCRQALAAN